MFANCNKSLNATAKLFLCHEESVFSVLTSHVPATEITGYLLHTHISFYHRNACYMPLGLNSPPPLTGTISLSLPPCPALDLSFCPRLSVCLSPLSVFQSNIITLDLNNDDCYVPYMINGVRR